MMIATDKQALSVRVPFRPTGEEWEEAFSMLCGMCQRLGECEVIEGMIDVKNGKPWPQGGWVTDPGAGITCLSYQPKPVRTLNDDELAQALGDAVPMCDGCAARKGTDASQALHTQRDFKQAVSDRGLFTCHKPGSEGKPCGGWCKAVKRQQKIERPVSDDHLYTSEHAGSGQFGICATCHKGPTPEGHDGCLGTLPGPIMNACCGHGNDRQAYIQYWGEDGASGRELRGSDAVEEQRRLIAERGDV